MIKEKVKLKDKTKNQVNVIFPYRTKGGIWCFDDEEVGLQAEPFVGNCNKMIDMFVNGKKKCIIYISETPIKDQTFQLKKIVSYSEGTYNLVGTQEEGWLCPATLKYFKDYPDNIYVKIEVK